MPEDDVPFEEVLDYLRDRGWDLMRTQGALRYFTLRRAHPGDSLYQLVITVTRRKISREDFNAIQDELGGLHRR